jgi:hypothetical protein
METIPGYLPLPTGLSDEARDSRCSAVVIGLSVMPAATERSPVRRLFAVHLPSGTAQACVRPGGDPDAGHRLRQRRRQSLTKEGE